MSSLEALFQSIRSKNKESVTNQLLENKNLIKYSDEDGWRAIHVCAVDGNGEILRILIDNFGADINQQTEYSYTPILLAAKNYNIDCLKELIRHKADINIADKSGMNAIDHLAEYFLHLCK